MKRKFTKFTYINLGVGLVLLGLLVATIVLLVSAGQEKDTRNDFQKYYDNKVLSYAIQNTNLAKGQVVFLGDSITDLYILDDHYADLPFACYNRGIGGDTPAGVLKRLQVSVFDLAPRAVVLLIGTNDVNGNIPPEEILSRYRQIVTAITTQLPDTKLYCISILPQNKQLEEYTQIQVDRTTQIIQALNPQIRQIAQEAGAMYVDLFVLLADENNYLLPAYSDDGIHLNETGLRQWTAQMLPLLTD